MKWMLRTHKRCSSDTFDAASSVFFFSSRRRHTRSDRDWSSDVCSSDLAGRPPGNHPHRQDFRRGRSHPIREVEMGFLLLGIDSLIACIAVGPIISRRWSVPFAALFGICDGGGFLLGSALHWQVPGNVSTVRTTAILVALGIDWVAIAIFARPT